MVNGTVPATYTADNCLVEVCSLAGIDLGAKDGIFHAVVCMLALGWNEDDVLARTRTLGVTKRTIANVKSRKNFNKWFRHYETLPDRSIEVARKLQAVGAPGAVARLLKSTFSEFDSISNKAAIEIVKGSGVSSNVESKPVINVVISSSLAERLNEAAKLVYKDVGDTEPLQLPVNVDEQGR
jgi:hypothetical protein